MVEPKNEYVRNRVPVPEPDVRTTSVADVVHIEKEPKLGSRPPFHLAYANKPSYDVSTGHCFATFIGTGP